MGSGAHASGASQAGAHALIGLGQQRLVAQVRIKNFRGIAEGKLTLPGHAVLIGDDNSGKSSVIEAIDLALGPDRTNRTAAIDEHDFYAGRYLELEGNAIPIEIEVMIVDLSPEQVRHFKGNLEFWDEAAGTSGYQKRPKRARAFLCLRG